MYIIAVTNVLLAAFGCIAKFDTTEIIGLKNYGGTCSTVRIDKPL